MKIPDAIEPVVGYRAWRVKNNGNLYGVGYSQLPWSAGPNEAACYAHIQFIRRNMREGDQLTVEMEPKPHGLVPDPDCECGFWVLSDLKEVLCHFGVIRDEDNRGWVMGRTRWTGYKEGYLFGRVRGWGRVVEAEHGWRCEFAEVEAFYDSQRIPEEFIRPTKKLAKEFGVPIEPIPARFESLAPEPKLASTYDYGYRSSSFLSKPKTAEDFEKQYAHNSGLTVEKMRELFKGRREVRCCHCGDSECQGWQMAYIDD